MMASMFSELIIAYLFLGGAGGGCCLVTAALTWLAQPAALGQVLAGRLRGAAARPWQRFFGALHLASLGALIVGAVCLMADLGRPDRLLLVLLHPVPTYVGFGAWAVILCIGLTAVNCSVWLGLLPATRRKLLVLSSLVAVSAAAVVLYTGLMLSDIPAIPLWNTPWLVALFVLSALSCGVALALCAAFVSGSGRVGLSRCGGRARGGGAGRGPRRPDGCQHPYENGCRRSDYPSDGFYNHCSHLFSPVCPVSLFFPALSGPVCLPCPVFWKRFSAA